MRNTGRKLRQPKLFLLATDVLTYGGLGNSLLGHLRLNAPPDSSGGVPLLTRHPLVHRQNPVDEWRDG